MVDERRFTLGLAAFFGAERARDRRDVLVGIGDDAAVVRPRGDLVLCCDPVVEGVHFLASAPMQLVGRKAVNRNLSDLAAMGAVADWLLVSLLLPRAFAARQRTALLRGVRAAARAANALVIGGDVANTDGPLVVTVTAVGHLAGRALTRSGARCGDTLHVTGALGGAAAGHHLRFEPALAEGQWLARQTKVHAAIDVSDGLLLDLATLLEASGQRGAEIDADRVPVRHAARRLAAGDAQAALRRALGDGEDHVLLWTQAPGALAAGGPLTSPARQAIGRIVDRPGLWLLQQGRRVRVPALGYRHALGSRADRPAR